MAGTGLMMSGIDADLAHQQGLSPQRLERVLRYLNNLIEEGKLPHYAISIERRGAVVLEAFAGKTRLNEGMPVDQDTVFRIYSMSKPMTTIAALSLYEEGAFQLDYPISRFLPEFANQRVYDGHGIKASDCLPVDRPLTIRDLLTHTSGITSHRNFGYLESCYADQELLSVDTPFSLREAVERISQLPLCFQPGRRWKYGLSTDVLGRVLEVISGKSLDQFLQDRIFNPLGMTGTGFFLQSDNSEVFAKDYCLDHRQHITPSEQGGQNQFLERPVYLSGGGGLVSTLRDYKKFIAVLQQRLDRNVVDIIAPKTLGLMTTNHLPGDLATMGQPSFMETTTRGIGFGFNVSILIDPIEAEIIGTPGEFGWGGLASTFFFVDPIEDMSVIFLTQVTPSSSLPIRRPLRTLVYQAITDPVFCEYRTV